MFELKLLHPEAIPKALEKAERYRLLNEPGEAASICQDILRIDPDNQKVLVTLLLSLTDRFEEFGDDVRRAREILPRLQDAYERAYYSGIVSERQAKAQLKRGGPGSGYAAHAGLRDAMNSYEKAETLRPPGNDDAILRWNACARIFAERPDLVAAPEDRGELPLE